MYLVQMELPLRRLAGLTLPGTDFDLSGDTSDLAARIKWRRLADNRICRISGRDYQRVLIHRVLTLTFG